MSIVQFGFIVLTTSASIMDHKEARRKNVGGNVLGFFLLDGSLIKKGFWISVVGCLSLTHIPEVLEERDSTNEILC